MTEQPLTPGEHVDLDSGVTVRRDGDGDRYTIEDIGSRVGVSRDDIETIAELAGFEVSDR